MLAIAAIDSRTLMCTLSLMNKEHLGPQVLLRAWPFPRGAGRIIDRFFSSLSFNDDVAVVRTTDGFSLSVMPNELIGRHLYLTGEFDRSTVEVLLKFARPGDALLDIGANIGYVSSCFLAKVPDSTAIAIEPQPKIVDLLRANLEQFGSRAYFVPVAISDRDGEGQLQIDRANRGASRLTHEDSVEAAKVEVWSPERLFFTLQPARIDLIKIDVEGHEESVFRGLEPFLAKYRPRLIMFEDHGTQASPDAPIGLLLARVGYSVFGVHKKLAKLAFEQIRSATDCQYNDYVAVPLQSGSRSPQIDS
jgi:FkbM family methyltransferase